MSPARIIFVVSVALASGCVLGPGDWDLWDQLQDSGLGPVDSDTPTDDTGEPDTAETGDTNSAHDTGPYDTALPAPELSGLTPAYGPRGGGSAVTISGAAFTDDVSVRFGDATATVVAVTEDTLTVTTPAVTGAATVDVTVAQRGGQAVLEDGFQYIDQDDESGMVTAKGALQWFDYRGSYWNHGTDDYGMLQLWFPAQPDDEPYRDLFAAGLDSCSSDSFEVDSRGGLDMAGASAVLTGELSTLRPSWNADETRFEAQFGSGEVESEIDYDLALLDLWGLPEVAMPAVVSTPDEFVLTSPDIAGSSPLTLSQDQLAFEWAEIEADAVVVYIARISGDGRETFEILSCLAENDGAFTVPPGAWEAWQGGNQLYTYVGAMREAETTVPLNNGTSSVVGIAWNVGVILTR